MGTKRNTHILVGKQKKRDHLEEQDVGDVDNIKMVLREMG
jgi:hypothetical protein